MTNGHLSDEMIQKFIWEKEKSDNTAKAHIHACDHCKARVANYELLFQEINHLPKPVFNFDLQNLVLNEIIAQNRDAASDVNSGLVSIPTTTKLNSRRSKNIWSGIIIIMMAIGLIGIPVYLFQDSFRNIIAEVSLMGTYLIIMTVVLVAVFLVIDEYRKYNGQMNSLDF